jgi:thiol-disulfide isomerase/thioredoxin
MLLVIQSMPATAQSSNEPAESVWYTTDADGAVNLQVHFFWAIGCPYCKREHAYLDKLVAKYSWLTIKDYEITENRPYVKKMLAMAKATGGNTSMVPTTFVCNQMTVGFQSEEGTGELLHRQMIDCYQRLLAESPEAGSIDIADFASPEQAIAPIELPFIGEFDPGSVSLPILTIAIATVDSFNPCGLFVLLMLMSMMIRAKSRRHMAVIGATFALTWAAMYFLLMTAWLSLFDYVGDVRAITNFAGVIVLVMAVINFKDYLGIKRGPTLSMSASAKSGLFTRMGGLVRIANRSQAGPTGSGAGTTFAAALSFMPMVAGTVLLTLSAGGYAILCTTGFAMTYTRVLTLHDLPGTSFLVYLLLYVMVYMIPMTLIVIAFTVTLGSRKLKDSEGRALKLLAGIMLASLAAILLAAPDLLKNPLVVLVVMMGSIVVAVLAWNVEKMLKSGPGADAAETGPGAN